MNAYTPTLAVKLALAASDGWTLNGATLSRLTAGNLLEGVNDQWVDLKCQVVSASWRRGALAASEFWLAQPGYSHIRLWDPQRNLDPANTLGPYYSKLRAGIPLQLTASTITGTVANVFTGFLWSLAWENDYATITGTDLLSQLAGVDLVASTPTGTGDLGIQRIQRILQSANIQTPLLQTCVGGRTMASTTLAGSCLTQVQDAVTSEFGLLLVNGDGVLTYGPEWWAASRIETATTVISNPDQITAATRPTIGYGLVRNSIVARATGLVDVTASNQPSIDYYGLTKWQQYTTLQNQADLQWWADLALLWYKQNSPGVPSSLTINPAYAGQSGLATYDYLLANEIIGRQIVLDVADMDATVQVYGLTHNVTASDGWSTTLLLIPNPFTFSATYWKLNSGTAQRLDFANVLQ